MPVNARTPIDTAPLRQEVLAEVRRVVAQFVMLPPEEIAEGHALLTDLGCDSLDIIEITMELEEQYDITVPDDQAENIRTVGDVARGLLRLLRQGPAA
jgi:acyl carrier protein